MARKLYGEDISPVHAFIETRDLHPSDIDLRAQRFRIHARPKHGPVVWELRGELFAQAVAEDMATRMRRAKEKAEQ